ncbi:MAG: hypothetical protein HZB38_02910 [Planctomycetes bacterium]|nr:hypothetical protein [Planctomycetota bacterium]
MQDYQNLAFYWAGGQSAATALVIFALGLLFSLQGFRFARPLFALTAGAGGFVIGALLARAAGVPAFPVAAGAAGILGCLGLVRFRLGVMISSTFVFATLVQYLVARFSQSSTNLLIALVFGAALGMSLRWVCLRSLPIILTVIQGAGLLVLGFVGVTGNLAPSLASTFCEWSRTIPLMIPVLLVMLFVLGYSVQANQAQGDLTSGGSRGAWNALELA